MNQFVFNKKELLNIAEKNSKKYQNASPCPHIYFDDFLPKEQANLILKEFPTPEIPIWSKNYSDEHQYKMSCEDPSKFPSNIRHILEQFNSDEFIDFLEKLTGIEGLITDSHYRGGGLHQIVPGGFLKVHVDFNWHKRLHLERRLNVLIYLNDSWKEEYGGCFELWDKNMTKAEVKILPILNRVAIFSTSEESFHGHPDPLACPQGMTRKSLALYYYSSPATDKQASATARSTLFKSRPGEEFNKVNKKSFLKKIFYRFISLFKIGNK